MSPRPKTPIYLLVPGTGTAYFSSGDEAESDLDVEYASTIGNGAQAYFVFTGSSSNYGVFNSLEYAVDNALAPSLAPAMAPASPQLAPLNYRYRCYLQQAATQGQTVLSAAGDDGSTDCQGSYTTVSA